MARARYRLTMPVRGEDGYVMIVTVTITMILSLLLIVVLAQGLHNNTASTRSARVNWAVASLQADLSAALVTNRSVPVADGSGGTGTATVTVRSGTPASPGKLGYSTIESSGQTAQPGNPTRTLRVVMGPAASFTSAIYANGNLSPEQNACIVGTVYAQGDIFFRNNSTIAGTSTARGSLISANGVIREFSGANRAKCPTTVDGQLVDNSNDIHGDVLAGGGTLSPCRTAPAGAVDASAEGFNLNNSTVGGRVCNDAPASTMPDYTFVPDLYANVQYYGRPPEVGGPPSTTAVSSFNTALANGTLPRGAGGGLDRTYVIWQDLSASQAAGTTPPAVRLDASALRIASDTVIYTNVPVDFGNTTTVEAAQACSTQDPPPSGTPACPTLEVISTYPGTPCSGGAGNCPSISGGNKIEFRPEVAVLYSRDGTIELQNDCNSSACDQSNQGAFHANTIDAKNNLNMSYAPRTAYALGFGRTQLQQVSWQELVPCPAGQTPPC